MHSVFERPDDAARTIRLHFDADSASEGGETARWRINGYRATIVVWTAEAWSRLAVHPSDAQPYPCGVWCALRLDD